VYSVEVGGEVDTRFPMCHGGWEVWVHGVTAIILGGPKVGMRFIVNYCIPTFGPSCMYI